MAPLPFSEPETCWLYLVRHAATDNNRARPPRLQGRRTDPGLSDEGFEQAESASQFLADVPLAAVYSSPLLRARQTAEAIARRQNLPLRIADALTEVDVGEWEGRNWEEIATTDAEAYRAFMTDASVHPYLGGENLESVRRRVEPAMAKTCGDHLGQAIAVVAHNAVNRVYLAVHLGLAVAQYRSIPQSNGGVNLLRYRPGRTKVVTINGAFHLP
jgi:broad specificity phosphatase PhoE